MSTPFKTSNIIEQQFPDFVRDDGPNLVAFLKAYYEWTEQANNNIEVSKNLLNYQDIDNTYDKYLEYFHREIMGSIPRSTLVDRKLLAKHIKDMYRSRGSELSYQLLFRILYNEEIEFYYPGQDMLRISDGRWVRETTIRLGAPRTGAGSLFSGEPIIGVTSGAIATVDKVLGSITSGIEIDELYLLNIIGTFQDGERVNLTSNNSIYGTIEGTVGPLQTVAVTKGGAFHAADDIVTFTSGSGGVGANGAVLTTTNLSAINWSITANGSGYTLANTVITITHNSGAETNFIIDRISPHANGSFELINYSPDIIFPMAPVTLNTSPIFVYNGANTAAVSANLAWAHMNTPLNKALSFRDVSTGRIGAISVSDYGWGYSPTRPTSTLVETEISPLGINDSAYGGIKGGNATITANYANGAIATVNVNNFGRDYNRFESIDINNQTRTYLGNPALNTQIAKGTAGVSGVITYPGRYTDTKGWLSWNNKLQDNYYYQEFSYELKSDQFTNTYRQLVNDITHPAGSKMFGKIRLHSDLEPDVVTISPANTIWTKSTGTLYINSGDLKTVDANNVAPGPGFLGPPITKLLLPGYTTPGNTSNANTGMYTVNAIASNYKLTLDLPYEGLYLSDATFYYTYS